MNYAEAAYFDGHPCQHVADFKERERLAAIDKRNRAAYADRRRNNPARRG